MLQKHKMLSLAVIGLVLGGMVGALVVSDQAGIYSFAVIGGIIGFLVGWAWNTRSGEAEN